MGLRALIAFLIVIGAAAPALALTDAPGTGGFMEWSPAVPAGTVYDTQISWNDQAEVPYVVTTLTVVPVNGKAGDVFRLRARACLGTLAAPTKCGPWSPWSDYVRLNAPVVTPGPTSKPTVRVFCEDPALPRAVVLPDGSLDCVAP